jgi:hypothetical protein
MAAAQCSATTDVALGGHRQRLLIGLPGDEGPVASKASLELAAAGVGERYPPGAG